MVTRQPPRQGDIWWSETEADRRPVLVVSRSEASQHLNRVIVAPVTRTIRGIPTEIPLGPDDGLPVDCVATFDNLSRQRVDMLTTRIGTIRFPREQICAALSALADC